MVMVSPYAIANQARLYGDDVTQYRPERWLARSEGGAEYLQGEAMAGNGGCGEQQQPQQQQGVVPDAIPFSVGPRDCVGRALADLELQVVVSMLVGRFRWEGDATDADDLKRRACYHVTLQPRGGSMMLRATPREAVAA
jgi:cytochrome P450